MSRQTISSGTPWEDQAGYSRAVKAGQHVHIAGTTATESDGTVLAPNEPYEQTAIIFERIEQALDACDAGMDDVVRTRMFVTDVDDWESIARAHSEVFDEVRPAATLVEVDGLVEPDLRIEIEATAYIGG